MKKIVVIAALVAVVGCAKTQNEAVVLQDGHQETGTMSVKVKFDDAATRSGTTYVTALDVEKKVNKIDILVFDKNTYKLNAAMRITAMDATCQMSLPIGKKIIYAIVNGPDPSDVTMLGDLDELTDQISDTDIATSGLTLVGSTEYEIKTGTANPTATITVGWLVSRVVLTKVQCNVPKQYGNMTVDCVFLGNANSKQRFDGTVSDMVNLNGLSADGKPVGLNEVTGLYATYLYRQVNKTVSVGGALTDKYYMYCQPNKTSACTCLYVLTTIGSDKYYYRVPLTEGLEANMTCSVELKITNLGSPEPPTGDLQKGNIEAKIAMQDWIPGPSYVEEF